MRAFRLLTLALPIVFAIGCGESPESDDTKTKTNTEQKNETAKSGESQKAPDRVLTYFTIPG